MKAPSPADLPAATDPRDERSRMGLAATMYYLQGETMDAVAKRLGTSRSTVSRLLKAARREGIVQITVTDVARESPLAAAIGDLFGIRVHVVPVRGNAPTMARLDAVSALAAQLIAEWFGDEMVLGLAWGATLSAVVPHLPRKPLRGAIVVQLNGAATASSSGAGHATALLTRAADAFDAEVQQFPTPAFFDYADTRAALWRERSVHRIIELQRRADIAVFGVGAVGGEIPSHLYSGDFLSPADLAALERQRVVGDVCTVFYREDGTWADIDINARASGPSPRDLATIPRRLCVVAGQPKIPGTLGALRAGVVTDLVIDDFTAKRLLQRARRFRP